MTSFRTVPPFRRNAAIVLSGAAATAVLWFVGLRELAWLGFFAAAVWWAAHAATLAAPR